MLLLLAASVWSQGAVDIPIKRMPTDSIEIPKSPVLSPIPIVSLEGTELTFDFSPATVSQIVIMDENHQNQVVYSGSFLSSTQVVVDLENEGVGKGIYLLWLYAFGEWWQGEFEIIEE
jgi:hypothetical protein